MSLRVIFLDFDGVLINRRSLMARRGIQEKADPPCVAALNRIIEKTDASIVVSSTWRMGRKTIELRELLGDWGVKGKVIDRTPLLHTQNGRFIESATRGEEIRTWMIDYEAKRTEIDSFVILDDDADMDGVAEHLVQTKFEHGLTEADADLAIAHLEAGRESHRE